MKLLLATHNRGKVADLQDLLRDTDFEVLSCLDFPDLPEVEEDGDTFLANARKKALEIFEKTGLPTLADDSGLEVEALDGAPGIYSARYAGEPSDSAANNRKLLAVLEPLKKPKERAARYVCVLVLVHGKGREEIVTYGECKGFISTECRGDNGFGYDPLFIHPAFGGRTMAEITLEEKNGVSHRGEAFRAMKAKLLEMKEV